MLTPYLSACWKPLVASALGASLASSMPAIAAGGTTVAAAPTDIEVVRNEGFLVWGAFGNPGTTPCQQGGAIWIAASHPQYKEMLSVALSALASGMKISAYVHDCTMVGWFGQTYNQVRADGALHVTR